MKLLKKNSISFYPYSSSLHTFFFTFLAFFYFSYSSTRFWYTKDLSLSPTTPSKNLLHLHLLPRNSRLSSLNVVYVIRTPFHAD